MQTCGISRIFQSTLPARGATFSASPRRIHSPYFNPRSPHGERHRGCFRFGNTHIDISIHAPRTGSDLVSGINSVDSIDFNPRSPHGERRFISRICRRATCISIHAPRTGSDTIQPIICESACISIHAPRTGSDSRGTFTANFFVEFQSTLPARGATIRLTTASPK